MITRMPATTKGRSPSRRTAAQTLVALIGALALTFGTGAMAVAAVTPDEPGTGVVAPAATGGGDSPDGGAAGAGGSGDSAGGAAEQPDGGSASAAGEGAGGDGASGESGTTGGSGESGGVGGSDDSGATGGDEADGLSEQDDALAAPTGDDAELKFSAQGTDGKDGKTEKNDRDGKDGKNGGPVKTCRTNGHGGGWSPSSFDKSGAGQPGWADRQGSDIIPPFSYTQGEETLSFGGQNWDDEGQEIWKHDCKKPKPPSIDVQVVQCTVPGGEPPATVTVTLGNLKKWSTYTVTIEYMGSQVSSQKVTAHGSTASVEMPVSGPGDYTASVKEKGSKGSSSTEFEVAPCPPPVPELTISGEAGECVVAGGTGTALVTIGGLVPDGVYVVTLWFGEEMVGMQTVENPVQPSAVLTFPISAFGDYTAQVTTQQWVPEYRVETPQPEQSASVVFAAGEGCPVPVTPAVLKPTPPVLAVTGSSSSDLALLGGGLLLALGAALVLSRGVTRLRSNR